MSKNSIFAYFSSLRDVQICYPISYSAKQFARLTRKFKILQNVIVVTQEELRLKDTRALIAIKNEISSNYKFVKFDYFTISAVAEYLYNKFKDKKHDVIYHTIVSYYGINKPFKIRINYGNKNK